LKSGNEFAKFLVVGLTEEKFITSGEVRLWAERSGGPGDPAVLLIMGTSAQGIGWPDELVDVLVAGGRQVIRFDHRDTGRSACVDFDARPYALAGQEPDPGDLPPPSPRFLRHLAERAAMPQTTREERVTAGIETWRVLNGDALPFDEPAARRFVETSYDRATDFAAAVNHDRAGRQMTPDRLAPLSKITAPALVIHGTEDPLRPLPHGQALATRIPHARLEAVPGMGHGFFSPGLPFHVGQIILGHTQSPPSGT
jgi:pimeloyl-ACP methyl ester carboxylesterase